MIDISFLLPTNRDHETFAKRVVGNINSLNFNGLNHEIVIISPSVVQGENVKYVKDNNIGCVDAYNKGYRESKGKYIFLCSDDHYFDVNAVKILEQFDSNEYKDRKYKVVCLPTNNHGPCSLPGYTDCKGIIARYPVYERDTVEKYLNGFIYHPSFKHHYPDNWLGYWLCMQGESAIEHNVYDMMTFSNSCYNEQDDYDERMFKELIKKYKNGYTKYI